MYFLKRSFPVFGFSPILWKIETRIRRHRILFNFSPREYIENTSRSAHPLPAPPPCFSSVSPSHLFFFSSPLLLPGTCESSRRNTSFPARIRDLAILIVPSRFPRRRYSSTHVRFFLLLTSWSRRINLTFYIMHSPFKFLQLLLPLRPLNNIRNFEKVRKERVYFILHDKTKSKHSRRRCFDRWRRTEKQVRNNFKSGCNFPRF